MKRLALVLVFAAQSAPATAADRALILNDARQQALYQALDAAVRYQGLAGAPALIDLLNVLRAAPAVEELRPPEPVKPPEPNKDDPPK